MNLPGLNGKGRYVACIIMVAAVFLLFEGKLFKWQIIDGDYYSEQSLNDRTDVIELEGTRGEILTSDGVVLAGNRTVYNIVFNALYDTRSTRNATILKAVDILTEQGEEWRDVLPIEIDENGEYVFKTDSEDEIAELREFLSLAEYSTAAECMAELCETYDCVGFSTEDARTVASVRYSMYLDGYSRTDPYVFAEDVSSKTVGIISQRSDELPGVEPEVSTERYYGDDGTLAAHIVGYLGSISEEEYNEAVEDGTAYSSTENISGYKWTDSIGKSGLEAAFESELRGTRGEETIYTDETGTVLRTAVTTEPTEGSTIVTTIDSGVQRAANISLAKNIQANTDAKDCTSGAAVVISVDDFGVLACSSYPTYDMNRFSSAEYYNELLEDEDQPMFDNALMGVFTPGSVFKPLVALAALQEGVINAGTTFYCDGLYTLGDDEDTSLQLKCTGTHGYANIYTALSGSCNVYFCNVGINLTIKKLDAYAQYFGLGEKTGVEIYEETGTMSNPQEYLENHGTEWLDGASAQTAIGQADNQFTPIQLATYAATMANGGVRLQTHFLEKVTDYSGEEVISEYESTELYDAGISSEVLAIVKEGMIEVGTSGTASGVFADYPVTVACKTGTAETSADATAANGTEANISFICYAPADDPEIAVAVMLEHGNKGNYAQLVAKDILDQYFGYYTWDEDGNRYDSDGNMVDDDDNIIMTREEVETKKAEEEEQEEQEFLSSAIEGGSSTADADSAATPSPSPDVTGDADSSSRGDEIPDTPYSGNETSEEPSSSAEQTPEPTETPKPDSPYYSRE